jgi:hypothetical protein
MAQTMTKTQVASTSTLPDGDALGNDIIAGATKRQIDTLLRKGGQSAKARKDSGKAPRVMFQPQAWSFSGNID